METIILISMVNNGEENRCATLRCAFERRRWWRNKVFYSNIGYEGWGIVTMTFGEKLNLLRKKNGISQEQLALQLNVSRQAISKWEMGSIPDVSNILKIASFFDCSLDYLLNDQYQEVSKEERTGEDLKGVKEILKNITNSERRSIFVKKKTLLYVVNTLLVSSIFGIYILSKIYPVPLFRQETETGNWFVGIRAFMEFYKVYGLMQLIFAGLIIGVTVTIILEIAIVWPKREIYERKKQIQCILISGILCDVGIIFTFIRFFFVNAILWNLELICVVFLYVSLLSASILLGQYYKIKAGKGEDGRVDDR